MLQLIQILKSQLKDYPITDIIQVGERELDVVVGSKENVREIKKLALLSHDDSEVQIKGITVNFIDKYGTRFGQL